MDHRTNMTSELDRIASFTKWSNSSDISALYLAKAGFCHIGDEDSDEVLCFSCNFRAANWKNGESLMEEHMKISPKCRFLNPENRSASDLNADILLKVSSEQTTEPHDQALEGKSTSATTKPVAADLVTPPPGRRTGARPYGQEESSGYDQTVKSTQGEGPPKHYSFTAKQVEKRLASSLVKTVIHIGHDIEDIRKVYENRLRTTGNDFPTVESLLEALAKETGTKANGQHHQVQPSVTAEVTAETATTLQPGETTSDDETSLSGPETTQSDPIKLRQHDTAAVEASSTPVAEEQVDIGTTPYGQEESSRDDESLVSTSDSGTKKANAKGQQHQTSSGSETSDHIQVTQPEKVKGAAAVTAASPSTEGKEKQRSGARPYGQETTGKEGLISASPPSAPNQTPQVTQPMEVESKSPESSPTQLLEVAPPVKAEAAATSTDRKAQKNSGARPFGQESTREEGPRSESPWQNQTQPEQVEAESPPCATTQQPQEKKPEKVEEVAAITAASPSTEGKAQRKSGARPFGQEVSSMTTVDP